MCDWTRLILISSRRGWVYAIGGVPPVAHLEPLLTILDPDLKNYDVIWAAAGTPNAVFELVPGDLTKLTGGRWVPLAK